MNYKRCGRYWHRLTTTSGTFYGHTRQSVFAQADAAGARPARSHLHLVTNAAASIARQEDRSNGSVPRR